MTRLFACQALLLAKERVGEGYNWQAGILSTNASSHTAQSLLQEAFPEWQGSEIEVHFKKAWSSLCRLIHQLDQAPFVCGDFSLEEVSQIARSRQRKKATRKTIPGPIVESGTAEQQLPEPRTNKKEERPRCDCIPTRCLSTCASTAKPFFLFLVKNETFTGPIGAHRTELVE